MKSWHLFLSVMISLLFILLLLPYTLLLLFGYKLYCFSRKKCFFWLNRLKPLLDSYYAPFNKHTRYWVGLLLVVRCTLCVVFSFRNRILPTIVLIFTFSALVVLLCWSFSRIYEKIYVTIIEISVYANIIVISFVSLLNTSLTETLSLVMVGIVFATTVCIVFYHFHFLYTAKLNIFSRIKYLLCSFKTSSMSVTANTLNFPQTQVSSTIIEPLLED